MTSSQSTDQNNNDWTANVSMRSRTCCKPASFFDERKNSQITRGLNPNFSHIKGYRFYHFFSLKGKYFKCDWRHRNWSSSDSKVTSHTQWELLNFSWGVRCDAISIIPIDFEFVSTIAGQLTHRLTLLLWTKSRH